jgi:glucose-6-phosphate isomerase
MIGFDESLSDKVLDPQETDGFIASHRELISKVLSGRYGMSGALGWFKVAENTGPALIEKIEKIAPNIRQDVFVLAGVGGSNRAAQSLIEGLGRHLSGKPRIVYAGNTLSAGAMRDALDSLKGKKVYANIIAKNFATLEPGIAFRLLRSWMGEAYGESYGSHILLTGSYGKGQLHEIAEDQGFAFLEFPEAVGGRFSAFTAVGLLPMAVMGVDIRRFIAGAAACEDRLKADPLGGAAARYAAARFLLQKKGFIAENFAFFEPRLEMLGRWWMQLHGETEGKNGEAVLPILSCFSEDLHAMGQFLQEGGRFLFETFLDFFDAPGTAMPAELSGFDDGFSYLDGIPLDSLNPAVSKATAEAHYQDGIPVLRFTAEKINEETLGEFMYLQMLSSYFSAAFLGVEPFDQKGVEMYKMNLQAELRKI